MLIKQLQTSVNDPAAPADRRVRVRQLPRDLDAHAAHESADLSDRRRRAWLTWPLWHDLLTMGGEGTLIGSRRLRIASATSDYDYAITEHRAKALGLTVDRSYLGRFREVAGVGPSGRWWSGPRETALINAVVYPTIETIRVLSARYSAAMTFGEDTLRLWHEHTPRCVFYRLCGVVSAGDKPHPVWDANVALDDFVGAR